MQGQLDTALDAHGRWQGRQLARALAHEAMHTAAPLAEARGLRVGSEPHLRERRFGVFEGFTYAHIAHHWPAETARWRARDPSFAPPRGESLAAFHERCLEVAGRLAQAHAGRCVVWVTHGGVLDCLYRAATRQALDAPRTWTLDNASINRLLHGDQGLMLIGWGDVAHLDASTRAKRELLTPRRAVELPRRAARASCKHVRRHAFVCREMPTSSDFETPHPRL